MIFSIRLLLYLNAASAAIIKISQDLEQDFKLKIPLLKAAYCNPEEIKDWACDVCDENNAIKDVTTIYLPFTCNVYLGYWLRKNRNSV
jgi:hypothetical protein